MASQQTEIATVQSLRCELLESRLRAFRCRELRNRQRASRRHLVLDLLSRAIPQAAGYAGLLLLPFPQNLIPLAMFSVATVSMLGSWYHDAVHKTTGMPSLAASFIERMASSPVGFSPRWWDYKHVRLHHTYVGNPEFDPDIQFGLFARVSAAQRWRRAHTSQHFHLWLLLPFATLNMLKPAECWLAPRYRRYRGLSSMPPGYIFLLDKYVPLLVIWLPVFAVHGWFAAYLFLIFQGLSGLLVSLVTQVQHNTALSNAGTDYTRRWPLCEQFARTADVGIVVGCWWWLSGGTNFHVVHHLVPSLSFLELPAATARLRREMADIGISYPVHATLAGALRSHARLLRRLSIADAA